MFFGGSAIKEKREKYIESERKREVDKKKDEKLKI